MKVVTAIDSFKGSLSSSDAGKAVSEGIKRVYPDADIHISPIADGGEGTAFALTMGMGGELQKIYATDPLGRKIQCEYGIVNNPAIIEMAAAAGITLLKKEELNPLKATTYGVGEIIKDAINKGCRDFIIGIGGSATNDGGTGMLKALGFDLLDKNGDPIPNGAEGLPLIYSISDKNALKELSECKFNIACDVENPLCGEKGCSAVFSPQKGADENTVSEMDKWLYKYSEIVEAYKGVSYRDHHGAGAAGGIGFAFMSFFDAELKNGIKLVTEKTRLEEYIKEADIVITGEGRLDSQSAMGKAPVGLAEIAKKHNKPVIAFSGAVTKDAKLLNTVGIDAFFPILREVCDLETAMENAYNNLADTAEQVFRVIKAF